MARRTQTECIDIVRPGDGGEDKANNNFSDTFVSEEELHFRKLKKILSQSPRLSHFSAETVDGHIDAATIPRILRHSNNDFNETLPLDFKNEAKVLVIYTGGTIGMVRNKDGLLTPQPDALAAKIRASINMHDEDYSKLRFRSNIENWREKAKDIVYPLILPNIPNHKRVIYMIYEYDPLLDSSNMTMDDWIQISKDIEHSYKLFDGFVILHGTDTLAYTASALSFMLENLGKPVILTGSQIPCFETRSDGRDNFVGALILAGNYNIPEVCVYFRHQLMRGNRTVKISSGDLNAFTSPNMSPLVKAGIEFEVDYKAIHRPRFIEKFQVHTTLNRNVVLLRLFPSIRSDTVRHFLQPPIEGVVLQCYGAGNIPSNRKDIIEAIASATKRGVIIVCVTQCTHGAVKGTYATGKALLDAGAIPGADITPVAALTKLAYVLSKEEWDIGERREMMLKNVVGEMTILAGLVDTGRPTRLPSDRADTEHDLVQAVAKTLHLDTSEEVQVVEEVLFPSIMCLAVFKNDMKTIKEMMELGADVSCANYDLRTPLHVACSEGNVEMVEFLMLSGAGVHTIDHNNDSPLMCAIKGGHQDTVTALVKCGAHLQTTPPELGEVLCFTARKGDVSTLQCYHLAGADLNTENLSLNTPLHMAVEVGNMDIVVFLLSKGVRMDKKNIFGETPVSMARLLKRDSIVDLLEEEAQKRRS